MEVYSHVKACCASRPTSWFRATSRTSFSEALRLFIPYSRHHAITFVNRAIAAWHSFPFPVFVPCLLKWFYWTILLRRLPVRHTRGNEWQSLGLKFHIGAAARHLPLGRTAKLGYGTQQSDSALSDAYRSLNILQWDIHLHHFRRLPGSSVSK